MSQRDGGHQIDRPLFAIATHNDISGTSPGHYGSILAAKTGRGILLLDDTVMSLDGHCVWLDVVMVAEMLGSNFFLANFAIFSDAGYLCTRISIKMASHLNLVLRVH